MCCTLLYFRLLRSHLMISLSSVMFNLVKSKMMQVEDHLVIISWAFIVDKSHHWSVFPSWFSWRTVLMAEKFLNLSLCQQECWAQEKSESPVGWTWEVAQGYLLFIYLFSKHISNITSLVTLVFQFCIFLSCIFTFSRTHCSHFFSLLWSKPSLRFSFFYSN